MKGDLPSMPYPEHDSILGFKSPSYSAEQMREYAKKAVEADRALRLTSGEYAQGYAEGFNDACKPPNIETLELENRMLRARNERLEAELAKRQWVGLTMDELIDLEQNHLSHEGLTKAIEAKLKEKNT